MTHMIFTVKIFKLKGHHLQLVQHPFLFSVEQLILLDTYLYFLKAGLLKFLKNNMSRLEDIFLNFLFV